MWLQNSVEGETALTATSDPNHSHVYRLSRIRNAPLPLLPFAHYTNRPYSVDLRKFLAGAYRQISVNPVFTPYISLSLRDNSCVADQGKRVQDHV